MNSLSYPAGHHDAGHGWLPAARRIKLSLATKDIPIIFLTAKTETDDIVAVSRREESII